MSDYLIKDRFMKRIIYFLIVFLLINFSQQTFCQPSFISESQAVNAGDNFCIPFTIQDFTQLKEINFEIEWDGDILQYSGIENLYPNAVNAGLDLSDFNLTNSSSLSFDWEISDCTNASGLVLTLIDNITLFEICFDVIGAEGNFSPINLENTYVTRDNANCVNIGLIENNGNVYVNYTTPPTCLPTFWVDTPTDPIAGIEGETYCFDVFANGLTYVNNFTYFLDYTEYFIGDPIPTNFQIPNLSEQNFNVNQNGTISMSWENSQNYGINLNGDQLIYQFCFEPLTFSSNISPPIFEFRSGVNNLSNLPTITNSCLEHSNCNADPIGSIDVLISGEAPPYLFSWTGPNNFSANSQNIANLVPGLYELTVTDANNETLTTEFQILSLAGEATITLTLCEAECDLLANPLPCEDGFNQYTLSTADNCDSIINAELIIVPEKITDLGTIGICELGCLFVGGVEYCDEGNYTVVLSSYSGCDSTVLFYISEMQADLISSITPDTVLCDPANFQLEVIAPNAVSYEWSPPVNLSCFDCPNPVAFPLFNEFFSVVVTDANGCTDEASVYIEVPFGLDWGLFPWYNSPVCEGENLQLMPQVPNQLVAWHWEGPGGFVSDLEAPVIPNVNMNNAGTYSVTVTDVSGCTAIADFDVTIGELPIADAGVNMALDCLTPEVILDGSGSSTGPNIIYQWIGQGINAANANVVNPIVSEQGQYTLIVTDTNTGCTSSDVVFVEDLAPFPVILIDLPNFCIESTFDMCISQPNGANFLFEWTTSDGTIVDNSCIGFTEFSTDEIGLYTITITDTNSGCTGSETYLVSPFDCVWPGDTDTNKVVNNFDLLNIGLAFDATGSTRANATLNWEGQVSQDWTESTPDGINYKHVDCDGNGIINADDTLGITQNWGLTHNLWGADDREMGAPFYVERDTFEQDTTYAIPVILGEEDFPAEEVYGIAFTLVFDTSIVASNASINFENSWLGSINSDMIAIQQTTLYTQGGRIDAGITRIDGQNMTGFGQMGTFFITIEDIIFQAPPDDMPFNIEKELIFKIENVKMIGYDGEEIAVDTEPQPSISTATNATILNNQIQIFPNPIQDILNIHSPNILIEEVEVFNIAGQRVLSNFEKTNQLNLNTINWTSGTYFIKIQTKEGVILKKIIK